MVGESAGRLAALLRGPEQLPVTPAVYTPSQDDVAARLAKTVTHGPHQAG